MEISSTSYSSTSTSTQTTNQSTQAGASAQATAASQASQASSTKHTDSYVPSSATSTKGLYSKPKKLTSDQINALKEAQAESRKQMLQEMANGSILGQGSNALTSTNKSITDLISIFNGFAKSSNLPALATDPEAAQAAITGDGPYSVNSVATRIVDMATALAGNDPEKLQVMRDAVEKGFSKAGVTFSDITGESKLPQICHDTYDEVMKRFDKLQEKKDTSSTNESNAISK